MKYLKNLDVNKSTGIDELSPLILKAGAEMIYKSVTFLINLSIRTNYFPVTWKRAKVIPIYKSESKMEVSNYRPISILPILSKI